METEPILVKSKISISTIFIIIAVFLCIGVIIFIIINNKSKTPDCKNKCNNADDGVGGKCTNICDVGMKCVDKTCVCAPDCSDNTKCDDGCGGTCQCAGGSVCFEKKCCNPTCTSDECDIPDGCGGTCKCSINSVCVQKKCCTPLCPDTDDDKCGGNNNCGGECPDECKDKDRKCINKKCSKIKYNQEYNMKSDKNLYLSIINGTNILSLNNNKYSFIFENDNQDTGYIKENDIFYIKNKSTGNYISKDGNFLVLLDKQSRVEFKMIIKEELTISILYTKGILGDKYLNEKTSQISVSLIEINDTGPGIIWLLEETN